MANTIDNRKFDAAYSAIESRLDEIIKSKLEGEFKTDYERRLRRAYARRKLTRGDLYDQLQTGEVIEGRKGNVRYQQLLAIHAFFLDLAPIRYDRYRPSPEMIERFVRYLKKQPSSKFTPPTFTLKSGEKRLRKFNTDEDRLRFQAAQLATGVLNKRKAGKRSSGKGFLSYLFNENGKPVVEYADSILEDLANEVAEAMAMVDGEKVKL